MSQIYIQAPNHKNFNKFLQYANKYDYSLEIASFAYSNVLDSSWQTILKDHQRKLRSFKGSISLHAAFQDLLLHSRDRRVGEIAKNRILQNLKIAKSLSVEYVIFHANFNPLISNKSYEQNWLKQNANFWSEIIKKHNLTILLENMWEATPGIFKKLLLKVRSPRLKICFDTGHANIFSKVPMEEWIASLHKDISYIHVNDNKKDIDNEIVPGKGTINWRKFSSLIKKYHMIPKITFEVGTLDKTIRSINYFRNNRIYPFN